MCISLNSKVKSNFLHTVTLSLAITISGCDISVSTNESPTRPDNIPASAIWTGGADGGVFVSISTGQNKGYHLQVFHENGDVWYEGSAHLKPENANLPLPIQAKELEGWDGTTLFLSDQRKLIAQESL